MESESELTNPEFGLQLSALTTTIDSQNKAWHILALLLYFGRPARPSELASKCTLFTATPDFIEFLCSLPNSPIYLTVSHFVTFSSTGYTALAQSVANSSVGLDFLPRFAVQLGLGVGLVRQRSVGENVTRTYCRKRKRMRFDDEDLPIEKKRGILDRCYAEENNGIVLALPNGTQNAPTKVYFPDGNIIRAMKVKRCDPRSLSFDFHEPEISKFRISSFIESSDRLSRSGVTDAEYGNKKETSVLVDRSVVGFEETAVHQYNSLEYDSCAHLSTPTQTIIKAIPYRQINQRIMQNPVPSTKGNMDDTNSIQKTNLVATSCLLEDQQMEARQTAQPVIPDCKTIFEDPQITERRQKEPSIPVYCTRGYIGNPPIDTTKTERFKRDKPLATFTGGHKGMLSSKEKQQKSTTHLKSQAASRAYDVSVGQNQQAKFSLVSKPDQKYALTDRNQSVGKTLENGSVVHSPAKQQQPKRDNKSIPSKQRRLEYNCHQNMNVGEKKESVHFNGECSLVSASDKVEQRVLPDFESFIAEEEEGSGGYGTVYRARRRSDGVRFAIKCPHFNANRNHVHNELKMLERFGGKNFVIKYEGSFKSGNSDCLVLEHVEHDRPEVLKREIRVSELQWYGYCMFRALSGLHKQGVAHRDIKPGNFLFNRKACKGYLIDFNLAMDLNQKHGIAEKTKVVPDVSSDHIPLPKGKSLLPSKNRKFITTKALEVAHQERGKVSKAFLPSKNIQKGLKQPKPSNEIGSRNTIKSQGADGSVITSAKDATSTISPSAEKLREPLPCQGRRELISLVQEALQGANNKAVNLPASKRKRVAAPPQQVNRKFTYITPMPLHSGGVAVGGAGLSKTKGDGKHNREGPCVGTKGFRAPEVLFRSLHQGTKVDMWSAGVTLLYLILGRTPFIGDPDQNIKEIAKLRGSEGLWEVAKLHNRESSFPADLFDIKSLPYVKLQDWCKLNTRSPDFFDVIPRSLFDLVDKCLTVNPRLRISAEEALRHEFFIPCHEALRKQRLLRQCGLD